jgi:predicted transposase/invertase (TIGR01784 family)
MDSETGERKFKDLEFNFIELQKFTKEITQIDNLVDKWVYFMKNSENLEVIPENINDSGLLSAYKDAEKHNWTKEELEEHEYAQMREQDELGQTQLAIEKALEHKDAEMVMELYKNGVSVEIISISVKLSIERVKEILNINE